ncbi:Heme-degrading monooxygenase HmoA [Rhizobium sp. RU35A]|uniref:antibiotic biosynthesis monooxygenase family protein n=1 Tax=Rhizobium sp. RU35A TaxID=1907414 RepID=UPI000956F438|nr:antibiotic biosynthesis monooxygenase [Rhizobium sp. RU35A]SIP90201.1 Heme-degrading monooxygenase HmoA [Rhizobium sp. RU35A]
MSLPSFAALPAPPYHVVTFASQRTDGDNGYGAMADAMLALAGQQPGFLGAESARDEAGFGITNSYWRDEESIRAWKQVVDHLAAQRRGRQDWYRHYAVRIGVIHRAYGFDRPETAAATDENAFEST